MDITFPPTVFIALGVVTAALLTGFFSYMNMVSSKENKVSEFRLSWLDGLRDEIAKYTSAIQELSRIKGRFNSEEHHTEKEKHELSIEWYLETREVFAKAIENLSKIQLRLNPQHVNDNPSSPEAKLLAAVMKARSASRDDDFDKALEACHDIRVAAAPILKSTWDLVKNGEPGYRKTRKYAALTVACGFYLVILAGALIAGAKLINANRSEHAFSTHQVEVPTDARNVLPHASRSDRVGMPVKEISEADPRASESKQ